jgi:phosphoribosylamine--glycine ligase
MGDPETDVVIPRIKNDLVEMFVATAGQRLNEIKIEIDDRTVATVVAVSGGYPGDYEKGKPISGLDKPAFENTIVFHSGTTKAGDEIVTNGGRVLAVTSFGDNISEAAELSNYMLEQLYFEGMYYRTDIGYEFN